MKRDQIPLYLAGTAAVTTVVSIAAFEILMALALVSMLLTPVARRATLAHVHRVHGLRQ